jgi:hypothetical protein
LIGLEALNKRSWEYRFVAEKQNLLKSQQMILALCGHNAAGTCFRGRSITFFIDIKRDIEFIPFTRLNEKSITTKGVRDRVGHAFEKRFYGFPFFGISPGRSGQYIIERIITRYFFAEYIIRKYCLNLNTPFITPEVVTKISESRLSNRI